MTRFENFLGGNRSFLPRTGGTSLRNNGRSFFAAGGVRLPGANAYRGVDPRLLDAFLPARKRWSEPRPDPTPAQQGKIVDNAAATQHSTPSVSKAAARVPRLEATKSAVVSEATVFAAPAPPAAPLAPAAAPAPAPAAALASAAAPALSPKPAAVGSGTLALKGTVSRPTGRASASASPVKSKRLMPSDAASATKISETPKRVTPLIPGEQQNDNTEVAGARARAAKEDKVNATGGNMSAADDASIELIRSKLTNAGSDIKKGTNNKFVYFPGGQESPISFTSKASAASYMGISHKKLPELRVFGEAKDATPAMRNKTFTGMFMAVGKEDFKTLQITPATFPQRQSGRAATIAEQHVNKK